MLRSALESGVGPLNELERQGVIQRFEYTFELAWNTLKDRLEYDGIAFGSVTPRSVIRQAYQAGLIQNGETWLDMLTDRNSMSHTYGAARFEAIVTNIHDRYLSLLNGLYLRLLEVTVEKGPLNSEGTDISSEVMAALQAVFACYPELTEVLLYGSRATGNATPRSDIDLATRGIIDPHRLGRLASDLEDANIPQECDVQAYEHINHAPLKGHIDAEGIRIYTRGKEANRAG